MQYFSMLVEKSRRIELRRFIPIARRRVNPPTVDEHPGTPRDAVPVDGRVGERTARNVEKRDVGESLTFH